MKKIIFYSYFFITMGFIAMGIYDVVNWWVATAPIWSPIVFVFILALLTTIAVFIGDGFKKKREKEFAPSCENCLFGKTRKILNQEQCMGEKMSAVKDDAGLCSFYRRNNAN